jgi:hypothetical protein
VNFSHRHRVCVVHLVRSANGIGPFRAFLDSYRTHPAGGEHELLLLFKGFESADAASDYLALAEDLAVRSMFVSDEGFDLGAYFTVVHGDDRTHYCFTNSFSTILSDGWLASLYMALQQPNVGIVSATGSWASQRSCMLYQLGAPNAYARAFENRAKTRAQFRAHTSSKAGPQEPAPGPLARRWETGLGFARQALYFDPFPSPHLRTNAFMAARETLAQVRVRPIVTKLDAYRLESGKLSITKQIESMGLKALVVGRDGTAYGKRAWSSSNTFWQSAQQNLIVADNQTREYEQGDLSLRLLLARFAWGEEAHAGQPD